MNDLKMMNQIMNGMPGGFFIYHAYGDEELIYANEAILRIYGCETMEEFKELTGFTFPGMVHPDDIEMAEKSIREQIMMSKYNLDYLEYRIIQKDGTIRWVEDYGHFMNTEEYGDVFYVFVDDATDRLKRRMSQLEEINTELRRAYLKEKQYRSAILQDAIYFYEVNLSKNLFVTSAVQILDGKQIDMFKFQGIGPFQKYTEFVDFWGKNHNLSDEESYTNFFCMERLIRCYEKNEREQDYEAWVVDSMGRRRLHRYTFLLGCDEETGDVIALALTRDLTDVAEGQKLLQLALGQAKVANIARSTFLSNISHDIRTPLNAIVGYIDLIRECDGNWGQTLDYLEKMKASSNQLLTIVNESLEYTRMESGRAVLLEKEGNILDALAEVENEILPMSNAKRVDFMVDKTKLRHYLIMADFARLKEVLYQLVDNAVKYTEPGGEVRLQISERQDVPKGYVKYEFVITDTGIGIHPEFLDKIFEPFEREYNTTASGVIGSGLGLAVVKSLIDMMEGNVKVESQPGKGSTFRVSVLFKLAKHYNDHAVRVKKFQEVDLKGKKILVVEDNEINLEITTRILQKRGMTIDKAVNGLVAVDMIEKSQPGDYDLVLMDIQMPVMDGYEATRRIRKLENKELSAIPIVALSANAFVEDVQSALDAGMNAHISKPVDVEELETVIREVMSNV